MNAVPASVLAGTFSFEIFIQEIGFLILETALLVFETSGFAKSYPLLAHFCAHAKSAVVPNVPPIF